MPMPDTTIIDALDPKSWAGIVIAKGTDTAFGFRFATDMHGLLDGESIYEAVREVGPHAPDGSYCRLKWSVAAAHGDMFSIRWQGKLQAPADGPYTFYMTSDDGCRLFIDGKAIIDEWWDRVPMEFHAQVGLAAGEHDIRVDYYECVGSASVKLEWSSESFERQVVPTAALSWQGQPGLRGSYYYGTAFQEFAFERVDAQVDFDYGHGGPLPDRDVKEQVCLEWSRTGEDSVVGKLSLDGRMRGKVLLMAYFPWDYSGSYSIEEGALTGHAPGGVLRLVTSPTHLACGLFESVDRMKSTYTSSGELEASDGDGTAGTLHSLGPDEPLYFAACLGGELPSCDPAQIDARLASAAEAYARGRVEAEGRFARVGESITNNINWMRLLIPHTGITYVPAGRVWVWSSWTVFEWDGFFNALLASVENRDLACSMIDALIYGQMENGNIANVANDPTGQTSTDRSQPQVGIYSVWKMYLTFGRDAAFLARVYPALVKWHDWWLTDGGTGRPRRDGNSDGLLEWGSDGGGMQEAKFESGMDDSPLYDDAEFVPETWTMNLNSVDCSSLYALDALYLAKMAHELAMPADEAKYLAEHEHMKSLINEHLWCEEHGMYLDRYWDGTFSRHMGCATFYPLIARVATPERARQMMKKLNDPEYFRGEWMIPTIARCDPAWKDQFYWRGTVWPPTNYLAYEGIKDYGFDREAAMVAESGADLFLENWKTSGTCRENYRSDTGEGGGQKYQSWGPLFSLIALEEFADVDASRGGLRFGSFVSKDSTARRLRIAGNTYDVCIGNCLRVWRDGELILEADGPAVVRGYRREDDRVTFEANTARGCALTVYEPGFRDLSFTLPKGRHGIICDPSRGTASEARV